jgi:hypothetical protein
VENGALMTRPTTGGCMSIDIRGWHREGRLRAGQCFLHTLTWNWQPTEGIGVLTKADAVVLMFRSRSWPGEYGPTITQCIPIAWTPCTPGGRRHVLRPPGRRPLARVRSLQQPTTFERQRKIAAACAMKRHDQTEKVPGSWEWHYVAGRQAFGDFCRGGSDDHRSGAGTNLSVRRG